MTRTAPGLDINEIDESQYVSNAANKFGGMMGITERGPVNTPVLCSSWAEYRTTFGDLIAGSDMPYVAKLALDLGAPVYVSRITKVDGSGVTTAVDGSVMLSTAGGGLTAGNVTGSVVAEPWYGGRTFPFASGNKLGVKIDGVAAVDMTIAATPATKNLTNAATFTLVDLHTIVYRVGGAGEVLRTIVLHTADFSDIGNATGAEVVAVLARDMVGVRLTKVVNQITISTDQLGTGAYLEFTGGNSLAALGLLVEVLVGGGNVADVDHVTVAELAADFITATITGAVLSLDAGNHLVCTRTVTGAAKSVQIDQGNPDRIAGAAVVGWDSSAHSGTDSSPVQTLLVEASSPGTWGNSLRITTSSATLNPSDRTKYVIKRNGVVLDVKDEVSFITTDDNYVEKVFLGHPWIKVTDQLCGLTPALARPADQTDTPLTLGDDGLVGIGDADYIGSSAFKTGLYAFDGITDCEHLGSPSNISRSFLGSLFTYCEARKDMWGVGDVPKGLAPTVVKDFRMATGTYAGGLPFVSTYGALYENWTEITDDLTKGKRWVPPMAEVFAAVARTDKVSNVWRAPAGPDRGKALGIDALYSKRDDTDVSVIYGAGVNSIVNDPLFGAIIDGQKTLAATPSKLDRINVRRGLIAMRQALAPAIRAVAEFEPNDEITWRRVARVVDPYCREQVANRGLSDYRFVCDKTTNTSTVIANHQLVAKLYIQPIDDAEFLEVDVVLVANDVDLSVAQ